MNEILNKPDRISISPKSQIILNKILNENPSLRNLLEISESELIFIDKMRKYIDNLMIEYPFASDFSKEAEPTRRTFEQLTNKEIAIIRLKDYSENESRTFTDLNLHGKKLVSNPFRNLWLAFKYGRGGASEYYFEDMLHLFRQLNDSEISRKPAKEEVENWMDRHPSGLDEDIIRVREKNRERIIKLIIKKIDSGEIYNVKYSFEPDMNYNDKFNLVLNEWWNDRWFHLRFAVRSPKLLNEMLDNSLNNETMELLNEAESKGIPFFVNPYYLTLLNISNLGNSIGSDLAIRDYIIYSQDLVSEYGNISAWEMEDLVEKGKPNAAGWILPSSQSMHRRYPEVAILIPDTIGRACGGLCSSCQRMYDFQRGNLNFNFDKLKPKETWEHKLTRLMEYYEHDSQLRDILITGGDALMSQNISLTKILNAVYDMAVRKKQANLEREDKYAEITRVRLGTRLPVYLPQRINDNLIDILSDFREKALKIGIKQFIIQTHFETAMEVTPDAHRAIRKLISAGWIVTNQLVLTASASRRGHTAKLRKVLNDIGVLAYYTFTVKGYRENRQNFATNARAVQEQMEEKIFGDIEGNSIDEVSALPTEPKYMVENINRIREKYRLPFLATDRNVLNLPGVGKSLTFRVIGITRSGRRIIEFDHDSTRWHSPIIDNMGKIVIVESKSIREYLNQLEAMGEDQSEYGSIWNYSLGVTEARMPIYEYPAYDYEVTNKITNLDIPKELLQAVS
jgi:lysine 2,3-aminomutase